ncbi:MAG: glutaconyl-CoA decarboxylase subunit beta [Candidatus Edwardsbacteria bacterium RIFOXYD12_FULL_50_11]|uniref:Glutaconyl-CoA decarboxylase subunit beta n=1 Tax=Candidatus Edwardsbacteria bacterium GWF2_54_11 TaxID=1817851 RepID=A0A1F5RIF0_9BACT|nr:MAG: glutaconyl-CoA decarboxylase subunit beta [Candidatus Edwardsbacteria bacterium RifOxyC12_full_54_24]OGF06921.1 MAG: glutaconyl-CoA decarboxylase subunit beta [Candidatus Edwardsbacteria bacterium RifOxyA12_full_54_48]OGF10871.1 MAG: glutaconyl-CoA decarboxylase subunit beta [Candidatus Edwardsbacteria bacterium GWE2_54_12]OGF13953.1 MAG: glutaconyl-CoA decarboxylase subunit beta [Candidatus Edwardsbacteria bacterium GWF2_54_11]OGF14731.1 MAG: glutaconyl-CoA decarboxylase subunit beta [
MNTIIHHLSLLIQMSGMANLSLGNVIMMAVSLTLVYLAVFKGFEPLLLLPIGFGAFLANLPLSNVVGPDGLLTLIYNVGVSTEVLPTMMFMVIGALTDFGPLLANPTTFLMGAAAQFGVFAALLIATALGFNLAEAGAIGIIGGADGPTAIFTASKLAPHLLGPIAVAAYTYMSLVPLIQPPIMRLMTTKKERATVMKQLRPVSHRERIIFPIAISIITALLLPQAIALIGTMMLGNIIRESGVTERLSQTLQNEMCNIVTILLAASVGATMEAGNFLSLSTLKIVSLGLVAFGFSTFGGMLLGKLFYIVSGGKVNPLIGSAGVSAVPMAARVSQVEGQRANKNNFLLMHAMGPNVAGVLGTAMAAGVLISLLK